VKLAILTALAAIMVALAVPIEPAKAGGIVIHYRLSDNELPPGECR